MAQLQLFFFIVALSWGSLVMVVAGSLLTRTSWGGRTGRVLRGLGLGAALLGGAGAVVPTMSVAHDASLGCGGLIALLFLPAVIAVWLFFRLKRRSGIQDQPS